ncbi:hypothetical protein CE91St46_07340 [Eubacteriales bacterium]|nr:hypothetical protein CE91St46_07340 [Eubacteriales bacterium]GKH62264.1 hypothetical protein CE91St47_07330 [Eubacteriales bacterium]
MKTINICVTPKPEFIEAIERLKKTAQRAVTPCAVSGSKSSLGDCVKDVVD